jgi:hypothetical protein
MASIGPFDTPPKLPTGLAAKLRYFLNYFSKPGDWHYVGEDGEPAFENSWANYQAVNNRLRFRYLPSSQTVQIQGRIDFASGTLGYAIFTLPAGYRSDYTNSAGVIDNVTGGIDGRVYTSSAGQIVPTSIPTCTWFDVNIEFPVGT